MYQVGIVRFVGADFVRVKPLEGGKHVIARKRDGGCPGLRRRRFWILRAYVDLPEIGEEIVFLRRARRGRNDAAIAWCRVSEVEALMHALKRKHRLEEELAESGVIEELMLPEELDKGHTLSDFRRCRYNTDSGTEVEPDDLPFAFEDSGYDNGVLTPIMVAS